MEKSTKTCLVGCGVGCGLLLVVAILAMTLIGSQVGKMSGGFEQSIESREELDRAFPAPEGYTPEADGAIPVERMERFLEIRAALAPARERIHSKLQAMELSDRELQQMEEASGKEKFGAIWDLLRGAFSIPGAIAEFQSTRNRILLSEGMSMGEYSYIFLSVHQAGGRVHPEAGGAGGEMQRGMSRQSSRRARGEWREMVERQAELRAESSTDPDGDAWLSRLQAEVARLDGDRAAWPWADGLPQEIAASVAPYRERLDALYDPAAHELELMHTRKEGSMSFTVE